MISSHRTKARLRYLGVAAAAIGVFCWSSSAVFIVKMKSTLEPDEIASLRGWIAAPVVFLAVWFGPALLKYLRSLVNSSPSVVLVQPRRGWNSLHPATKASMVAIGATAYGFASQMFVYATRNQKAGAATFFFFAVSPAIATTIEWFIQRLPCTRINRDVQVLTSRDGLTFSLVAIWIAMFSIGQMDIHDMSYFAASGTAVAWGVCVGMTSWMSERARYLTFFLGTVLTGAMAIPSLDMVATLDLADWILIVLLGVFALGLPLFFFGASQALVGRSIGTMLITTIQPALALLWIWVFAYDLFVQENFRWWHYVSAVLILLTIGFSEYLQVRTEQART